MTDVRTNTTKVCQTISPPLCEIILNQPERRNALSQEMWAAIPELIAAANRQPDVKVIILHGGASGHFAAGADISEFSKVYSTVASARESSTTITKALEAVAGSDKPVIAAIEGVCIGGGVSLAMTADLRIASNDATFGVTPGKLGLVYPAADTRRLLQAIGTSATKDLLFTGRLIKADEAQRIGLIDRTTPPGESIMAARLWAEQIASISQWSVRSTKRMIQGLEAGWSDDDPHAQALFLESFSNEDFKEGYSAFLEKRPAVWKFK